MAGAYPSTVRDRRDALPSGVNRVNRTFPDAYLRAADCNRWGRGCVGSALPVPWVFAPSVRDSSKRPMKSTRFARNSTSSFRRGDVGKVALGVCGILGNVGELGGWRVLESRASLTWQFPPKSSRHPCVWAPIPSGFFAPCQCTGSAELFL